MKLFIVVTLATVCIVGLSMAAPYPATSALAEREDADQRALIQGTYLSKMKSERKNALAQGYFSDALGYLEQLKERKGNINALSQGYLSDALGYLEQLKGRKGNVNALSQDFLSGGCDFVCKVPPCC